METTQQKVARSELDAAVDVSREIGWMVVQSMPTTPWGYVMYPIGGEGSLRREPYREFYFRGVPFSVELP